MTRHTFLVALTLLAAWGCDSHRSSPRDTTPADAAHTAAADLFNRHYAQSHFTDWHVQASAAGSDCAVLLVRVSIVLDDSMVEALHYGAGVYGAYPGGVRHFANDRGFNAVAYRDSSGRNWTYGPLTAADAATLVPCH